VDIAEHPLYILRTSASIEECYISALLGSQFSNEKIRTTPPMEAPQSSFDESARSSPRLQIILLGLKTMGNF